MTEKMMFSKTGENENCATQCVEVITCQAYCQVIDNRTEEVLAMCFFYVVPHDESEWRRELERISSALGFTVCGIKDNWFRKGWINSLELHRVGKALD